MAEQYPSSTPVIERVPTAQELEAHFALPPNPRAYEAVSPYYTDSPEWDGSAVAESEAPVERKMLTELGNELQFGPAQQREALTRNAFAVSRQLADKAIVRHSREAFGLVDDSRRDARRGLRFADGSVDTRSDGSLGYIRNVMVTENRGYIELGVSSKDVLKDSAYFRSVADQLSHEGVAIKDADLSTMLLIMNTGHEAGHIVQNGLANSLEYKHAAAPSESTQSNMMGAFLLSTGNAEPTTGNLKTDAEIYNEQFAEGYGRLAMTEAARILGYDEATIDALSRATSINHDNLQHPHLLEHVTSEKDIGQLLTEAGERGNPGELGYTRPLDVSQIAKDLETVSRTLAGEGGYAISQASYNAANAARAQQPKPEVAQASVNEKRVRFGRVRKLLGRMGLRNG